MSALGQKRTFNTLREQIYFAGLALLKPGGGMDDPLKKAKEKAATTYDAAADHFDDEPLSFWDRVGKRTVASDHTRRHSSPARKIMLRCLTAAT